MADPKPKSKGSSGPDFATLGGLVLAIGAIAGGLIMEGGKVQDVAQVTSAIIVLGGVSRAWSRRLFDRFTFRQELAERRVFAGERVRLDVSVDNRKPLPLPWFEWRVGLAEALPA